MLDRHPYHGWPEEPTQWTQLDARSAQRRGLQARRERNFGITMTIVLLVAVAVLLVRGAVILWQVWGPR